MLGVVAANSEISKKSASKESTMDGSGKRITNGTFEPGENDEDTSVVLEAVAPVYDDTSLSQQFYDCRSTDNNSFDNDLFTGTTASASSRSKKTARRPSGVGSIPLKPYVGGVNWKSPV